MLDYLSEVSVAYDETTDIWTISGSLNVRRIIPYIIKTPTGLFPKFLSDTLTFRDCFLYEVVETFKYIIRCYDDSTVTVLPRYILRKVNIKGIQKVLDQIEKIKNENIESRPYPYFNKDNIKKLFKFTPLKHQQEVIDGYPEYKRDTGYRGLLIDSAAGTGKTALSLYIAEALEAERVIIIGPLKTIHQVWTASINKSPKEEGLYLHPEKNTLWRPDIGMYNHERFLVVHYEAMSVLMSYVKYIKNKNTVIIVDESHNFGDPKSNRTEELNELVDAIGTQDLILLSGTPVKAYSLEIVNLTRLIDRRIRGRLLETMLDIYRTPKAIFKELIRDRYKKLSFKVKKEALKELQPLEKIHLPVKLPNGERYTLDAILQDMRNYMSQRMEEIEKSMDAYRKTYKECLEYAVNNGYKGLKDYQKVVEEVITAYEKKQLMFIPKVMAEANRMEKEIEKYLLPNMKPGWREVKTIIKYPMLKVIGECLGKIVLGARIACHKDIARALNYNEIMSTTLKDTIVFSQYIEVCDAAAWKCTQEGYHPVAIYGDSVKNLNKEIDKFKSTDANPLIATYKAAGESIPLTNANIIIVLDLPYRMYVFDQAVSRAWRKGQDSVVKVYIPVLDTGDKRNINQRNFDIISFFNEEVERLTGYKQTLTVDETKANIEKGFAANLEGYADLMNYDAYFQETECKEIKNRMLRW